MNIFQDCKTAYRYTIESKLVDKKAAKEVLDMLFDEEYGEYIVYRVEDPYYDSKWYQRINMLWVIPLCCVVCPFKWLFTGSFGFNQHKKFGKFVAKLIGA